MVPTNGQNVSDEFIPSLHSFTGELQVSLPVWNQTIDSRVIATTQQLAEFPYNEDISGTNNDMLGIGWAQSSMVNGERASSSTSYLASANDRPNLTVLINAMVTKLLPIDTPAGARTFRNVQFSDARTFSGKYRLFSSFFLALTCLQSPLLSKFKPQKKSSYQPEPWEHRKSSSSPASAHRLTWNR